MALVILLMINEDDDSAKDIKGSGLHNEQDDSDESAEGASENDDPNKERKSHSNEEQNDIAMIKAPTKPPSPLFIEI